jgi:hypothetical protein
MAIFSCNRCGSDDIIIPGDDCVHCQLEDGRITESEYDEYMKDGD